jgi:tRNA G18 (ribose-2'-O)-methylase SpoU
MRGKVEDILNTISLPIVVADMNGANVFTNKLKTPFCLVIGNEGRGVSQIVRERASVTVSIPMQNDMESLNAAVSAGILMYNLKNH